MAEFKEDKMTDDDKELVSFIVDQCNTWRDHRDVNYLDKWEEYERLFRGIWDSADKTRESERSRLVTPALQQAIESKQAEISEAVFGRGEFFDIADDRNDQDPTDVALVRKQMHEDFKTSRIKKSLDDIILLGELYGTGIGEILVKEKTVMSPATQAIPGTQMAAIGVQETKQFMIDLYPVNPRNFLIEPNARTVEDSLGVAIEEYVSYHSVVRSIADGTYRKVNIMPSYSNMELEPVQEVTHEQDDRIRVTRYYGLVPREYLENVDKEEGTEVVDLFPEGSKGEDYQDMVEAIVVIADDQWLLKAEASPYMMKDRPIVAYQADSMPGRFWGRGTAEKGYYQTAQNFQAMLQQATGTLDSTAMPGQVAGGEASGAGLSMALSGLMKKNKRTLINFQEDFLIPFITKAAYRFMQFDPDRYPVQDFTFIPVSTMGMVAREYEQQQMMGLMSTLGQSPITPVLLQGIIQGSSISNREEIIAKLQEMSQPDPMQQQMQQLAMETAMAELQKVQAEAAKAQAEAAKAQAQAQAIPLETQIKAIEAQSKPQGSDPFTQVEKVANLALKEQDIASNERIAMLQMAARG